MTAPNIGDLVRALAGVSWGHLHEAVKLQMERPNERLGSLLVKLGAISRAELYRILDRQAALRAGGKPQLEEAIRLADYATAELSRGTPRE